MITWINIKFITSTKLSKTYSFLLVLILIFCLKYIYMNIYIEKYNINKDEKIWNKEISLNL